MTLPEQERLRPLFANLWSIIMAVSAIAVIGCGQDATEPNRSKPSFAAQAHGPVPSYRTVELGTLGGDYAVAHDINEVGQVVGISGHSPGVGAGHAFLWQNGVMTDLGTLRGGASSASGINDAGQVVGGSDSRAFLWQNGVMTDLGALAGGCYSEALSINNVGQVVGLSTRCGGITHAFLWQNGTMTDLGTLDGLDATYTVASDINDSGQIVGTSGTHAFLWQNGVMTDLGTLGGLTSGASAINNAGQVVGQSAIADPGYYHAFLWQAGVMTDLGAVRQGRYSFAYDINDAGQVVAYSSSHATQTDGYHAALWEDGRMIDLGPQQAESSTALGVNEGGQIVGYWFAPGEDNHAVMWVEAGRPSNPGPP